MSTKFIFVDKATGTLYISPEISDNQHDYTNPPYRSAIRNRDRLSCSRCIMPILSARFAKKLRDTADQPLAMMLL